MKNLVFAKKKLYFCLFITSAKQHIFHNTFKQNHLKKLLKISKTTTKRLFLIAWYKRSKDIKIQKFFKKQEFYEQKIKDLMKQLIIQNQELAKEKQTSLEREIRMKSLLSDHANRLYEDLCNSN